MKKIILAVVLLAAAGGALYIYFKPKLTDKPTTVSYTEKILGDWKIDSLAAKDSNNLGVMIMALDSNLTNYAFRFAKDGSVTQLLNDSIVPVKRTYTFSDSTHLVFNEGDSLQEKQHLQVLLLTNEQLHVMSNDSTTLFFRKLK